MEANNFQSPLNGHAGGGGREVGAMGGLFLIFKEYGEILKREKIKSQQKPRRWYNLLEPRTLWQPVGKLHIAASATPPQTLPPCSFFLIAYCRGRKLNLVLILFAYTLALGTSAELRQRISSKKVSWTSCVEDLNYVSEGSRGKIFPEPFHFWWQGGDGMTELLFLAHGKLGAKERIVA